MFEKRRLTPSDLEVLVHCYTCPDPHPRFDAPAIQDALKSFLALGAIEGSDGLFRTTDLGSAWVELILQTPVPVVAYLDPRTKAPVVDPLTS